MTKSKRRVVGIGWLLLMMLLALSPGRLAAAASDWPYEVSLDWGGQQQGVLWLPEPGRQLRVLVIAFDQPDLRRLLEADAVRKMAGETGAALLWLDLRTPRGGTGMLPGVLAARIQQAVNRLLAAGKQEAAGGLPMILGGPGWPKLAAAVDELASRGRVLAGFARGSGWKWKFPSGIPALFLVAEGAPIAFSGPMPRPSDQALIGVAVSGAGQGAIRSEAETLADFLRKTLDYRLTAAGPGIKVIEPRSGWLVKPGDLLGGAGARAVPYRQWRGDPTGAFWYYDRELAQGVIDRAGAGTGGK